MEVRVEVDSTTEALWQAVADIEAWPQWTASIRSVEKLREGPLTVGMQARIKQPRLPAGIWTVTAIEPGEWFEWELRFPGAKTVAGHQVAPRADGGSILTLSIHRSGWAALVVDLLFGSLTRRYMAMEAQGLRRCAEQLASA